jgi:hypothetical protein
VGLLSIKGSEMAAIKHLKVVLASADIPYETWCKSSTKTLQHLLDEITSGESVLVPDDKHVIKRQVSIVGIDVFYETPAGDRLKLEESKQVFKNGMARVRTLPCSVSEKMNESEKPHDAAVRGLREELSLNGEFSLSYDGQSFESAVSPSYPGLQSEYVTHRFTVLLNDEQHSPDGYIETQNDKKTHFEWQHE